MAKKYPEQAKVFIAEIEAATRRSQQALGGNFTASGQSSSGVLIRSSGDPNRLFLSNVGPERYFWFTPDGESRQVPARVLDIHVESQSRKYSLLIEYLEGESDLQGRVRHVAEITEKEFHSIRRDPSLRSIDSARELFGESLSPVEVQTQKLAKSLEMRLFGFTSFDRHLERAGVASSSERPMVMMNILTSLAMEGMIIKRFGALHQIYSDPALPNVVDAFSRLSPKYVLEEFKANDFVYTWVITEDGQLKVMPKGPIGNNLKPQLLRLSGGRRIFAGGDLRFQSDGFLNVTLNSNFYQMADEAWGAGGAFRTDNPNLDEFVRAVFASQAEARVGNLSADRAASFTRGGEDSGGGSGSAGGSRSRFEDFVDQMRAGGRTGNITPTTVSWNEATGKPTDFEKWVADVGAVGGGLRAASLQLTWAHYVLKTDPSMSQKELKKAYAKLSLRFHPDRKETGDEEVQKLISNAYELIQKSMR